MKHSFNKDKIIRRGSNFGKRLVLPLAGMRRAVGITDKQFEQTFGYCHSDVNSIENAVYSELVVGKLEEFANDLGYELEINFVKDDSKITLKKD